MGFETGSGLGFKVEFMGGQVSELKAGSGLGFGVKFQNRGQGQISG